MAAPRSAARPRRRRRRPVRDLPLPRRSRTCRTSTVRAVADRDREAAAVLAKAHDARVLDAAETCSTTRTSTWSSWRPRPRRTPSSPTQALRSGRHVFCEKPLATSREDLGVLVAAAADATRRAGRRPRAPLQPAAGRRRPAAGRAARPAAAVPVRERRQRRGPRRTATGSGTRGTAAASSSSTACTSSTPPRCCSADPPRRCRRRQRARTDGPPTW